MNRPLILVCLALAGCSPHGPPGPHDPVGEITGSPALLPEGCAETPTRICELSEEVRFDQRAAAGLVWASKAFGEEGPDGTTDGASIPQPFWEVIGRPYDQPFLRPAILHDHYTYRENRVRTWRQTHRMFYDALRHEGVEEMKALLMYYAVYTFGGHWAELRPGEDCGEACIRVLRGAPAKISEPELIDSPEAIADLWAVWAALNGQGVGPMARLDPTPEGMEALAAARHPDNLFLREGAVIEATPEVLDWIERRGIRRMDDI